MEQQQRSSILRIIQKIFEDKQIEESMRVDIVAELLLKYPKAKIVDISYPFDQFRTDNQLISVETFDNTPVNQPQKKVQSQKFETPPSFSVDAPVNEKHITKQQVQKERNKEGKNRKLKIKKFLQTLSTCFQVLLNDLHLALSHLTKLKMGKQTQFQIESLYLSNISKHVQNYKQQLKKAQTFDDKLEISQTFAQQLIKKIPQYSDHFIDRSKQIKIKLPSKLFKPHF